MSKNILIIATSPRRNGNSNRLAKEFENGAKESGNIVQTVYLDDKKISFCKGCLACQKLKKCVIADDANSITQMMRESDVIVWATPVYYYCMSGQMKTMIDRSNPLFVTKNKFSDIYLLASAADTDESAMDATIAGLNGWIACHEGVKLKGVVKALGVDNAGTIEGNKALKEAYNLGKSIL